MAVCHSQMAERGIGFVGDITSIQPGLIRTLVESDYIPVVASVAADFDGPGIECQCRHCSRRGAPLNMLQGRELAPFLGSS